MWFALSYILTGVYRFTDGVWRVGDILVPLGPQCAPWGSSGELLRTLIRPHPAKMHTKRSKRKKKPWMNTVNKTKNKEDIHLESHVPIWCEVRQHLLAILMFPIEIYTMYSTRHEFLACSTQHHGKKIWKHRGRRGSVGNFDVTFFARVEIFRSTVHLRGLLCGSPWVSRWISVHRGGSPWRMKLSVLPIDCKLYRIGKLQLLRNTNFCTKSW